MNFLAKALGTIAGAFVGIIVAMLVMAGAMHYGFKILDALGWFP